MNLNTKEDFLIQLEKEKEKEKEKLDIVDDVTITEENQLEEDKKNSKFIDFFYDYYKNFFGDNNLSDKNLFKIILKFQEFIEIQVKQEDRGLLIDNEVYHIIEDGLHLSFMKGIVKGVYNNDEIIIISQTFLEINEHTQNIRQYS